MMSIAPHVVDALCGIATYLELSHVRFGFHELHFGLHGLFRSLLHLLKVADEPPRHGLTRDALKRVDEHTLIGGEVDIFQPHIAIPCRLLALVQAVFQRLDLGALVLDQHRHLLHVRHGDAVTLAPPRARVRIRKRLLALVENQERGQSNHVVGRRAAWAVNHEARQQSGHSVLRSHAAMAQLVQCYSGSVKCEAPVPRIQPHGRRQLLRAQAHQRTRTIIAIRSINFNYFVSVRRRHERVRRRVSRARN